MNKEKMIKRGEIGITLIALVITIIVLLILAGVSIAMLTGDNGILTQANEAKTATEQGKVEEMVSVAIGGLRAEYLGDKSQITPQKIAEQVNKDNNRTDVTASNQTFPTEIIFEEEKLKVPVDIDLNVGDSEIDEPEDLPIYSEDIDESQIAPTGLFDFEIIQETASNTEIASTGMISSLPQKEARITRIKPEYCNGNGYNPDTNERDLPDTNYEIDYEGITDTLIVPYQVEIDGEMYKITEVDLSVEGRIDYWEHGRQTLPSIENIIYPNTVKKISEHDYIWNYDPNTFKLKNIILSENLTKIPGQFFKNAKSLEKIKIPHSVKTIGGSAFGDCDALTTIEIPSSVTSIGGGAFSSCDALTTINLPTSITTIENDTFSNCYALTSIDIPSSVISIEEDAFVHCTSLTNINIPSSVTNIGDYVFGYCKSLKTIEIPSSVTSLGRQAFYECSALTTIDIPSSVTEIGGFAFENCTSLTTINIAKSEDSIEGAPWGAPETTKINWNYQGK